MDYVSVGNACQIQHRVLGLNQREGERKGKRVDIGKSITLPPSKVESRPNFPVRIMKGRLQLL